MKLGFILFIIIAMIIPTFYFTSVKKGHIYSTIFLFSVVGLFLNALYFRKRKNTTRIVEYFIGLIIMTEMNFYIFNLDIISSVAFSFIFVAFGYFTTHEKFLKYQQMGPEINICGVIGIMLIITVTLFTIFSVYASAMNSTILTVFIFLFVLGLILIYSNYSYLRNRKLKKSR